MHQQQQQQQQHEQKTMLWQISVLSINPTLLTALWQKLRGDVVTSKITMPCCCCCCWAATKELLHCRLPHAASVALGSYYTIY